MSKQCLDVHQMQHLQELGLDTSNASALYCIDNESGEKQLMWNEQVEETDKDDEYFRIVPAYTLQDVLDAMPSRIRYNGWIYYLAMAKRGIAYELNSDHGVIQAIQFGRKTLIDAAYELLVWAIENKFVEPNKNE